MKLVIPCCSNKKGGLYLDDDNNPRNIVVNPEKDGDISFSPEIRKNIWNPEEGYGSENWNEAYQLYSGGNYGGIYDWAQKNDVELFILSAAFGLVHPQKRIPKYDVTYADTQTRVRRYVKNRAFNDDWTFGSYQIGLEDEKEVIFYIGSQSYESAFRRIVRRDNLRAIPRIYRYQHYCSLNIDHEYTKYNWYYRCWDKIIKGDVTIEQLLNQTRNP